MKFLKMIAAIFGIVILMGVLAAVLLVTFVSPNRFKPLLTEQVKKLTGRELVIDGNLSWTVYPNLGIKVGHLELKNPSNFKQDIFAEIQSATMGFKILPLLHRQIESSGITLNGLKLNLIKNAEGKTNWQDLEKSSSSEAKSEESSATETVAKNSTQAFAIAGFHINNATLSWTDEMAHQSYIIDNLNLHVKNINLANPFPLHVTFNFTDKKALSGKINLTSQLALNLANQNYKLRNLDLKAKLKQDDKNYNLDMKSDIIADLSNQTVIVDNLKAQMANLILDGNINVAHLNAKPKITGHFEIQPFDGKKWLQATGQNAEALEVLNNVRGNFNLTAGTTLDSVDLKGNIKIAELKAGNARVTNIILQTQLQKSVLDLTSLTASFYQGDLAGKGKVNLSETVPHISFQAKLSNVHTEALLNDLAPNDKLTLTGLGDVDLHVTTSGKDKEALIKNLKGTTKMNVDNGALKGIDIGYLLDNAFSLATKQSSTSSNTDQTPFGSLTATSNIENGIVTNNDLYLNSTRIQVRGKGTIDLNTQQINYHLEALAKQSSADQKNSVTNLYGLSIPIVISGNMTKPTIQLDTSNLMKAIAQQQLKKVDKEIQKKVENKLGIKLPDNAADVIGSFLGH